MSAPVSQLFTPEKQACFLEALAELGHVGQAAERAGITTRTAYYHRKADAAFAEAWEAALGEAMDTVLEPEAVRRAVQGIDEPVYQKGDLAGYIRRYSDTLLIFLLKAGKPDKYKDRKEVYHKGAVELLQKLERLSELSDEDLED